MEGFYRQGSIKPLLLPHYGFFEKLLLSFLLDGLAELLYPP